MGAKKNSLRLVGDSVQPVNHFNNRRFDVFVGIILIPGAESHQYTAIRQCKSFLWCSGTKKQRTHGSALADADGRHIVFDELHRVIDGHARRDRAAGRIYVQIDVAFRILGLEEQ